MTLSSVVRRKIKSVKTEVVSPWKGPQVHGVTQSLLSLYMVCQERFRIKTILGLATEPSFNKAMEFGNMWHVCEEEFARGVEWEKSLLDYCKKLVKEFPLSQEEIIKWHEIIKQMFPIYVSYWENHPHILNRTPCLSEETFHLPYELPSGREVYLNGKIDSADLIGKGPRKKLWLQENKCKGEIKEENTKRQLGFDLQTMMYPIALLEMQKTDARIPPRVKFEGVRYNIIRRPLSGGKGSIRQLKPTKKNPAGESLVEFIERLLTNYVKEEPDTYFMRWNAIITPTDFSKFKEDCLHPVLENLCDDYEWWEFCHNAEQSPYDYLMRGKKFPEHRRRHFRLPYGIYNPIAERRMDEIDEYLLNGSEIGLRRVTNLFPELPDLVLE